MMPRCAKKMPRYGIFTVVTLIIITVPALSQTKWFKYEGNPVMVAGSKGSWDDAGASIFRVIIKDGQYRAWYTGSDNTHRRIGYATSRDGISWTKYPRPVLDLGTDGTWDYREVATGHVLYTGSKYLMWYHGYDGTLLRIGYAESDDGIVWTKAQDVNPVLTVGPSLWDGKSVGFPCVMGDEGGVFKMWYSGYSDAADVICYALGKNAVSWTKRSEPVLMAGAAGSWDDHSLLFPKVLFNGKVYEMWFAGSRGVFSTSQTGYATSPDGIHWTKDALNPVLKPGVPGSWDASAAFAREVLLDGNLYRMWYGGFDGVTERTGFAVSPEGTEVKVSADRGYVTPGRDSVRISVRVANATGLSFSADMESPEDHRVGTVDLFDDGLHADGLAGDGLFANRWLPTEEKRYSVDIKLRVHGKENLNFKLNNAGVFTTVGPVKVAELKFMKNKSPNPGDTVLMKLVLRNEGSVAPAELVTASLSTSDRWISGNTSTAETCGTISHGNTAATNGYYRFFISPNCPPGTDIRFLVNISSAGFQLWQEAMILHVVSPWWRTRWAEVMYIVFSASLVGGAVRYVGLRKIKRKIKELEQERAIEHERARISQDMHDEVGARLTEIAILGELAQRDIQDPEKAQLKIQKISETSREVIANIGEIIWAINTKNDSLDDLIAYLREYTSSYLDEAGIPCTFRIPEDVPVLHLSAEARRNIFLVVKEALHNMVKHSRASKALFEVVFLPPRVEIHVDDNGQGFDASYPSRFGNGLRNMEKRMSVVGGSFTLCSKPGEGTKITLSVKR